MRIEMREAREKIIVAEDIRLRILSEAENLKLSKDRQEQYNDRASSDIPPLLEMK